MMNDRQRDLLLIAVVQAQDTENAILSLQEIGLTPERLPSVGGFLSQRNSTLLIGLAREQESDAIEILKKSCRQRIEYITVPLESAPLPLPTPTPITIGGATIFSVEIEHYEEI